MPAGIRLLRPRQLSRVVSFGLIMPGQWTLVWLLLCSVGRAELVPQEHTVDFGRVSTLQTPQREVLFRNAGKSPLDIYQAQGSCGCVQAEVLTPRVPSNELGRVRLTLYPLRSPPGRNVWELTVRYRVDNVHRELKLAVVATIIREITVQPPQLDLSVTAATESEIVVQDHRAKPLRILRCETAVPQLTAHLVESKSHHGPPFEYRVRLHVCPELPQPTLDTQLVLHTDDVACPRIIVPVRVRKLLSAPILVSPSEASFVVRGNTPLARLFTFRERSGKPCRIAYAEANHPALKCHWPAQAFPVTTLRVTVNPELVPNEPVTAAVTVQFAEPINVSLSIPIRLQR